MWLSIQVSHIVDDNLQEHKLILEILAILRVIYPHFANVIEKIELFLCTYLQIRKKRY
jgi:hypothetical protein